MLPPIEPSAELPEARRDGTWPRVYRPSRKQRLFYYATSAGSFVMATAFIGGALLIERRPQNDVGWRVLVILVGLCFMVGCPYLLWWIRRCRVVLFEHEIELVEHAQQRLHLDEIRGLRIIPMQYGFQQFVFELQDTARKPVKAHLYVERDDAFHEWLGRIPNLDLLDQANATEELLQRPDLGGTEDERRRSLMWARSIARVMSGATFAAGAWGFFHPQPYWLSMAVLVVIPIVTTTLILTGRDRYAILGERNDVRPGLQIPLFGPGLALMLRVTLDVHVIDWQPLVVWATIAAIALSTAIASAASDVRRHWYGRLSVLLFLAPHAVGALCMANMILDRGAREVARVAVTDKHFHSGKGPHYDLHLASGGSFPGVNDVAVSRQLYESVKVGDVACVEMRPGALRFRWYFVRACDETP
ncbi:hypothetical protein A7982_13554 [Minicystis rosea]|nr:hypothetical protein A7982_13554 [Minicystis rosea]